MRFQPLCLRMDPISPSQRDFKTMICNVRDTFYSDYTLNVDEGSACNDTDGESRVFGEPF